MKKFTTFILGLVIALFLVGYMLTFQVPHDRIVIKTRFNKADEANVYHGSAGAGRALGNLYAKWFAPIDRVYELPALIQELETQSEQLQMADNKTAIVQLFVAWQITDPLAFFRTVNTPGKAAGQLQARLRDAKSQITAYRLDELTNPDPAQLKLADAEQAILKTLQESLDADGYGITIRSVGIKRMILPENVANTVFDQMRATRQRLAAIATKEGESRASTIKSNADAVAREILSFANQRASEIRSKGKEAVATEYEKFRPDPEFAQFLQKLRAIEQMLSNNPTIVADPRMVPFDLFPQMSEQDVGAASAASLD